VKRTNKALGLRPRLLAAAKHAGLWVATVASIALVLAPLGSTPDLALAATTSPTATPAATAALAALPVGHSVLARIDGAQFLATYLPVDAPLLDAQQLQTFRVRFQVDNATTAPITVNPRLEYRQDGRDGYVIVPEDAQPGAAFSVTRERVSDSGGSTQSPLGADIAATDLMTGNDAGRTAVSGHHSMGLNPDAPLTLPANSYTEQEFTVRLTADADYLGSYDLRITDAGTTLTETATASIHVGARPPVPVAADAPKVGAAKIAPKAKTVASPTSTVRYALAAATPDGPASSDIHGPYSLTTAQCAFCHRAHTAKGPNLLTKAAPQSGLCFTCHDGTGAAANLDVQGQYSGVPANKTTDTTRALYSHDVTAPTTHTLSSENEFGGVSNRHSECADCHNPHDANAATVSTETSTGWTASGRVAGTSGVSVENHAAGTAPTYTFVAGKPTLLTREYELCFKCHSGFTTLPSNDGFALSSALLDKGKEFNPNNASFHPIEAPGTNKSAAMTASLAGSPFTTDSTIRCSNCHAGSATINPPDPLAAGADLAPHASKFQGILLQNYRDRVLKGSDEPYQDADFALCLMCHAKAPYATPGPDPATNFDLHGEHLTAIAGKGSGGSSTNIDTAGAGDGNAICAECHFRLHSTTFQVPGQTLDGSRLVNFAPDVEPAYGTLSWANTPGGGSCTLTCHGHKHNAAAY
jgi:predicted CXXCH cytochrome family protein